MARVAQRDAPRQDGGVSQERVASMAVLRLIPRIVAAFSILLTFTGPLTAQPLEGAPSITQNDRTAALIAKSKQMLAAGQASDGCRATSLADEIIVCGRRGAGQRLQSLELPRVGDPPRGKLRAPPPGAGVGVSATMSLCILQQCPKPVIHIDVKALPEAPSGSDADLIARGEMSDR